MRGGICQRFRRHIAVVEHRPTVRQRQIVIEQVFEAALEAATNVRCGNVMTAFAHAFTDAGDCVCGTRKPEIIQFNFVTKFACASKKTDVSLAAQRGFQREGFAATKAFIHLREQQRAARTAPALGFSGEIPRAISSAFKKRRHFTSVGRNSLANVVLPAPLHPAIR